MKLNDSSPHTNPSAAADEVDDAIEPLDTADARHRGTARCLCIDVPKLPKIGGK